MKLLIIEDDGTVIDEIEFSDSLTHSAFLAFANEIGGPAGERIRQELANFDYDADLART